MELTTVARIRAAFYRLVGTTSDDDALVENGETAGDVADQCLTEGFRAAQLWLIQAGYSGWRARSSALSFSGSDLTAGGRSAPLPADFLRAAGDRDLSALVEADGTPWGREVEEREAAESRFSDGYYFKDGSLWLTYGATPPNTLYLEYHQEHPPFADAVTLDFPTKARAVGVAEAADYAVAESWIPGGAEMEAKIARRLERARKQAREALRLSRRPRQFRAPRLYGSHW